jgi:hypothetical protein
MGTTTVLGVGGTYPNGPVEQQYELRHVVLDRDGKKVQDTILGAWTETLAERRVEERTQLYTGTPPTLAQTVGDHFYGIGWTKDRALLAFTKADGITSLTSVVLEVPKVDTPAA